MSRPRKMLPVIGQEPVAEVPPPPADPVGEAERSVVRVEGMDCASCAATVEKRVFALPGVRRATVNFAAGRLDAEHDPGLLVEEIERAVEGAGYRVARTEGAEVAPFWRTRRAALTGTSAVLFLIGLALSLAGASQVLATGAYAAAILVGGLPIFRAAVAGLRARQLDMNVLMGAATIGAAGIGEWAEAASVVVLFSAGNALQAYAVDRTRGAVRSLARLAPDEVLVRRGGGEVVVAADEVGVGEMVVVRPGERLAVDGVVVEGESAMDESPVTGEGVPVEKGPGAEVYSGALNGSGGLVVRATKRAAHSTLQRISRLVEEAQAEKAPAEVFVDRFSRVYTPIVVAGAAALAVAPPLLGASFGEWFYRALALLIIACPCALVISTPVTVVAGIGAASRRGILVKGGAALEAAGRLRALALDKTGTLTEGRPVLSRVVALGDEDEDQALALAAALERRSEHPLAYAILSAAEDRGAVLPAVTGFRSFPGRGAAGRISDEPYLIGSPRLFAERGISLVAAEETLEEVGRFGETPVVLGHEDRGPLAHLRPRRRRPSRRQGDRRGAARRRHRRDRHAHRGRGGAGAPGGGGGRRGLQGAAAPRAESRGGARAGREVWLGGDGRRRRERRAGARGLFGRLRDGRRGHGRGARDGRHRPYAR